MAVFRGFETIELFSDDEFIYIEQFSKELGKVATIKIPKLLWEEFGKDVSNEIQRAIQE